MSLSTEMDQARALLEKAGVDQWELAGSEARTLTVAVRDGEVDKFQAAHASGLSIRVYKDGRPGFAYLMGGEGASFPKAVDQAVNSARAADVDEHFLLAAPGAHYAEVKVYDPSLAAEPTEAKLERANLLLTSAKEYDSRVTHVHPAQVGEAEVAFRLVNSLGLDLTRRSTRVSASAVAIAADGEQREMEYEGDSARFLSELDPAWVGREAARRAVESLGGKPVPDGRYPVIMENRVAGEFLELLASSLMGDNLVKGRSLLANLEGKQALSPIIKVIDDGLRPHGLATAPFDGEGTAKSAKELIAGGVVQGFLFDLAWASRAGRATTGNSVRGSLKAPPSVGMSNLYLEPGAGSLEDLAADMGRGLIIRDVMGIHTADPVSGEFSLGASGSLVEGGRVARPVKSIAIAGQLVDMFSSVDAVGGDLRFFGSLGTPSLLISGLSVSGG